MKDRYHHFEENQSEKLKRDLGFFATTAIIMGQMIGSGIYMTPQGLAELSNPRAAILAMLLTGMGTMLLALCFARLGSKMPASGSAVVYTRKAFGNLPAFIVGWSYWCGCWIGNGAIVLGGISYASYFFPSLSDNGFLQFIISVSVIWIYTFINIKGVKGAGNVNLILTIVKLLPLAVFIVIAIPNFDVQNLNTVSSDKVSGFHVLPVAIAYSLWSFTGFEGASVNAGEVKHAGMVKTATVMGTAFVIILYLLLVILAAGNLSQAELAASNSPFSDIIFRATGGYWAGGFISLGVCISAFGCIGAWIISSARIAYSLGEQGLFPKLFQKVHPKYRTPYVSLIINAVLMTVVMFLGYITNQGSLYNFLVLLAVMSLLIFYAFGAASEIRISYLTADRRRPLQLLKNFLPGLVAFGYSVYTIYGSGKDAVFYGVFLILLGLPLYLYARKRIL
ncbi:APC family permease [Sinanaerobacter chloroacetimidivorans]|jgi:APA family basic amino acid/polyamine antiporter|uniref:Amino acid permease n=1 Tax=Sinanaerobacter chloroacetimidivorans TaxID=2818044 RepID=A0A8J7W2F3_9FIRM|nr:amino acid permease [Sinanaerobacter chloroacetimidivorans]MBR0599151.1 amino acid permease [Sinanaerobacter chloroacetimidivorans]